jgi:hypothetical protein
MTIPGFTAAAALGRGAAYRSPGPHASLAEAQHGLFRPAITFDEELECNNEVDICRQGCDGLMDNPDAYLPCLGECSNTYDICIAAFAASDNST